MAEQPAPVDREAAFFNLAVRSFGECLADMGRVMAQGPREDNAAARGNIAAGLERTAAYLRGQIYEPTVDPKHEGQKGTMG